MKRVEVARFLSAATAAGVVLHAGTVLWAQTAYVGSFYGFAVLDVPTNTTLYASEPFPLITGVAVSPDGKSVYVAGFSNTNPGVEIFDTQSATFGNLISTGDVIPTGPAQLSPDGRYLYVEVGPNNVNRSITGIAILDTTSNTFVRTINLPFVSPGSATYGNSYEATPNGGVAFTPDTQFLYAINQSDPSQIAKIDTTTGDVIANFSFHSSYTDSMGVQHATTWVAAAMAITSDGSVAYLTGRWQYTDQGTVVNLRLTALLAIDTNTNSIVATVPPYPEANSGDYLGFIVCGSRNICYVGSLEEGHAYALDTAANVIQSGYFGSSYSLGAAFTPDGRLLYSGEVYFGLAETDTETDETVASRIALDAVPNPTAIAFSPASTFAAANPKELGNPTCPCGRGDPINVGTGNVFERVTDYRSAGANTLEFSRSYNSRGNFNGVTTLSTALGTNWRSNYDRYLNIGSSIVRAERPDGQQLTFTLSKGVWTSDSDVDVTLTQAGSTWTLTDRDDTVETYAVGTLPEGILQAITLRNGYTQNLTYNTQNQLATVTDSYNRSLSFTYGANGFLEAIATPDNLVLTYSVAAITGGSQLTSVSYNTSPASSQTYLYENTSFPFVLTGITDENGSRFASWTYDSLGRATYSSHGSNADSTTLTYNSDGSTIVTNAVGVADTYAFSILQGVPKVTQISRAATSTTAAATETFTYDSNGYMAGMTDWDGNQTSYVNDAHGDPTTINEAVGASAARTTTIAYDSRWVHLPASIVTAGLTTGYTYDGTGEVLTKMLTDTTTSTAPYSTHGQTRTWTNTWSNSLLASVQTPNGNTTTYGYDGSGALVAITDAKGHVTNITSHTGGGLPLTIVDPNSVTTTLTYDQRQRLTSSTVSGATGTYKTSWVYDAAGNLITTTLPDSSLLTNAYDTAHRLIKVTDSLGNNTTYTLDALGDRAVTKIYSNGGTVTWQRGDEFDALGRLLVDTAGAGQTTTRTFDTNGNVLTVTDGLSHTTTNTYDALNRLATSTDANSGVTTPAYDTHDRIVSVADANGNSTLYAREGFGDVIQQTSPDSGVTVFHYDGDANLTSKTDARSIVTDQTFDALDRPLTTTYPADAAENVSYTYDQTGTGFAFGIGRLTSVSDAAGSLTRTYEERGNLASETRVNGKTTLATGYTYDGASRVASMTYPDRTLVTYQHDAAGYISAVSAQLPGASSPTSLATLSHLPFGPMNGMTYGNGVAETRMYDSDYRAMSITDTLSGVTGQNLTYVYDNANNVKSITDAVNPQNSQTLGYDAINRLTSAASETGGYGPFTWIYDKVGNWQTQIQGSVTTTYSYAPGSNRLVGISAAVTSASLSAFPRPRRRIELSPGYSSPIFPAVVAALQTPRPPESAVPTKPTLTMLFGWPMLLAGVFGIVRFRKRLLTEKWFGAALLTMLAVGSARLLIGCGGGSGGSSGSPAPPPTPAAATPTFSVAAGTYAAPQAVTISDTTTGATIYYTTDGSTPNTGSTKYASPVTVSASETLSAIAVASGYTNSGVAQAAYKIDIAVSGPVASDSSGNITSLPVFVNATSSASTDADRRAFVAMASTLGTATASFTYNNANRLASVTGTPLTATFAYDWSGQRFSKTNPGSPPIFYSYMQGGTLIAENDNGAVTDYIYADGRPIAVLQPGASTAADQMNYVHTDRLGTPQIVTNSSGSTVWSTTYQPFGTTGVLNAAINQNLRFPGQNFDAETGFNYNLNRDYVPYLGRYLESDPVGLAGGPNSYVYADGNPLSLIDRLGLDPTTETIRDQAKDAALNKLAAKLGCDTDSWCRAALGSLYAFESSVAHQAVNGGQQCIDYGKAASAAGENALFTLLDKLNPFASATISPGLDQTLNSAHTFRNGQDTVNQQLMQNYSASEPDQYNYVMQHMNPNYFPPPPENQQ